MGGKNPLDQWFSKFLIEGQYSVFIDIHSAIYFVIMIKFLVFKLFILTETRNVDILIDHNSFCVLRKDYSL